MSILELYDNSLLGHSYRVSYYAGELTKHCWDDEELQKDVEEAAMLHDVGKLSIPKDILYKKDRLTEEEFAIMKQHISYAKHYLSLLSVNPRVCEGVLTHHERWDGKGYPGGYEGEGIPLIGRILCIADSFDAMLDSNRVYKSAFSLDKAIRELEENKEKQFDAKLVERFVALVKNEKIKVLSSEDKGVAFSLEEKIAIAEKKVSKIAAEKKLYKEKEELK